MSQNPFVARLVNMGAVASGTRLEPHQTLDLTQRKGRYGIVYMRAIAGQAGCLFTEPDSGEDALAVDHSIGFPEGPVYVQVKTTKRHAVNGTNPEFTYTAHDDWIRKWTGALLPIYFVVVLVPEDSAQWLEHDGDGTRMVRTAAYWCLIDPGQFAHSKTVHVPRSQRVTADTLVGWRSDLVGLFTPIGGDPQ